MNFQEKLLDSFIAFEQDVDLLNPIHKDRKDALKIVANGVIKCSNDNNSVLVITHYQRLLDYIVPDYVHIVMDGKVVKSGDKNLAKKIEEIGYDWLKNAKS